MRHLLQEFRGTPRADRELGTYLSAGLPVDTSTTSLEVTWDITRPGATWIVIRFWAAISVQVFGTWAAFELLVAAP